jgi:hypothetical protein
VLVYEGAAKGIVHVDSVAFHREPTKILRDIPLQLDGNDG